MGPVQRGLMIGGLLVGGLAIYWFQTAPTPEPPDNHGSPDGPGPGEGRGDSGPHDGPRDTKPPRVLDPNIIVRPRKAPGPNPCADDDPCTLDRMNRTSGKCIHIPDALCIGKSCETAADCAFDPALGGPCIEAQCHEKQCRFMRIARDECTACSTQQPCVGTYCDPRACRGGFCRHAPRSCDDGDPNTFDRCDQAAGACRHHREPPVAGRPFRCKKNTDCVAKENDKCFAGPCEAGFCRYREVANSNCAPCTGDHDCQELATFCNWPICTGTVCVWEQVPFCLDDNAQTLDSCSEDLKGCLHRYQSPPAKCGTAAPDDGDAATVDACHPETGAPVHLPRGASRCSSTNKCWDVYEGPKGICLAVELHCFHDDACPALCNPASGCVLEEDRDCHCKTDQDCDLGNPCARVFCLEEDGGACWGTFIDDCIPCKSDGDCRVDDWCVLGACSEQGFCTYRDGYTCDDGDPKTY
ncbi:MAG: hypothetical protein ACI9WU_004647, partial [Myxococcota bacterium]